MLVVGYILFGIYITALILVSIFCLMQFHLLFYYTKGKLLNPAKSASPLRPEDMPFVTIQLPIFNERYVIERLIDTVALFDYPKDRFEIHILDDSTDDTLEISRKCAAKYREQGFNIEVITRTDRVGFKAGALKYDMQFARGEFIAIFDADFMPEPDFLMQTLPHFSNPKVGVVQTRWGHINQNYSLITELQAFQLNVHFTVEQCGRESGDYMLQFNGTAGVWRRETIEDAGGWEADTLTEDLDLSYRAQMRGWTIEYLEDILSPAELPAEMNGLKSQQFRWMKGGAETARKMLPTVWKSDLSLARKIHATMHLMSSGVFLCVFIIGVFSVPVLFFLNPLGINRDMLMVFLFSLLSVASVYFVANVQVAWKRENYLKMIIKFLLLFPIFLALSMGLSLHNSIAVIQGYLGRKSAFMRTPKYGITKGSDKVGKKSYLDRKISKVTIAEGLMALYFLGAIYLAYRIDDFAFFQLHVLLLIGYTTTFIYSVAHARRG